jgi:lipopolysaccharide/colanic/teichoic acid biosynthesis glycosyltransferase
MLEARAQASCPIPSPLLPHQPRLLWGLDAKRLHDLFWAARGIQVVRPGQPADPEGPRVFLLVRAEEGLMAQPKPWLKRLTWAGCPVLSLRIVDRSGVAYHERVVSDSQGRLERIDRVYPRAEGVVGRVVVTTDERAARLWAGLSPGREKWSDLHSDRRWARRAVGVSGARLFDLTSPDRQEDLVGALVENWRDPGRLIEGIYQFKPGVWVHESVEVPPTARLAGPLWIGAGEEIRDRSHLIGPLALEDAAPCKPPGQTDWDALRLPFFPLAPKVRVSRRITKRAFDVLMSVLVLAMTLPFYPLFMLLIYLEDGRPFFFAHGRQTLGGRNFPCWKFRTMIKDAEKLKAVLQAQNLCDGPQFYIARDPRLLRCGAWFRRLQIDELPQFWNVLLGHMSVVGPRPSPDKENQFCPAWREARLSVRPGITGLWQVRRTRLPETDFQEWIRYDLEYVQHQSWRMDVWIIAQTVRKIIGG